MNEDISIKFDAAKIKADAFMRIVSNFFKAARNISDEVAKNDKVDWLVSVAAGSAVVMGQPRIERGNSLLGKTIVGAYFDGVKSISNGAAQRPAFFNNDALEACRAIATLAVTRKDIGDIRFVCNDVSIVCGDRIVRTIDDILGTTHKSFGEIEGKLSVLSDQGVFKFIITEPIHGLEITCYITDESLTDRAVKAFRKRISAGGLIKYRRDGTPMSIDVSEFKVFDAEDKYPSVDDIIGIYKRE